MAADAKAGVMTRTGLDDREWNLIREVFSRHAELSGVVLFGSRAKGAAGPASASVGPKPRVCYHSPVSLENLLPKHVRVTAV